MLTLSKFSMAIAILLTLKAEQVVGQPYPEFSNKISPALLSALENDDTPDVLVMFSGGNAEPLQRSSLLTLLDMDDRGERSAAIRDQLMEHSDQSQDEVLNLLSSLRASDDHLEFRKFWISNQMWVKGADMKTIRAITEDPQVAYVNIEPVRTLFEGEEKEEASFPGDNDNERPEDGTIQWNIQRIRAPEAWQELGGTQGERVLVGVMDSGVLHTHEALRENFLGDYGWLDATVNGKLEPYDEGWHGTRVTSLAVGSRGIGVAPGATWSHCKACRVGCKVKDILVCGEFFACPTLANGTDPDCSKAPHVIVNSWGTVENSCDGEAAMLEVWATMGIIPVFAVGNYGRCESIACPGVFPNVIGVGSINIDNSTRGTSSSKGPTNDGRIKPDITAYGEEVLSATPHTGDYYSKNSGTSFSCPQVAGVVALLLSRDLTMSFAQITELLYSNTDQENLELPGTNIPPYVWLCDSVIDGTLVHPNNHYGFGLVNALEAVKAQATELSPK